VVLEFVTGRDPLRQIVGPVAATDVNLEAVPVGRTEAGSVWTIRLLGTHILVVGVTGRAREYAERWIAERRLAPRTRELYEGLLRNHIAPHLGRLTLDKISTATVRTWRKKLVDGGRSETTAAKAYRLLRAVFNTKANEDRAVRESPCRLRNADREPPPERPVASVDQVYALAAALPARFRVLVLFAAVTGLR